MECPGAIVSKFSGLAARPELVTSPQQNWQQLSKLQELVAGAVPGPGARLQYWIVGALDPRSVGRRHTLSMTTSQATAQD